MLNVARRLRHGPVEGLQVGRFDWGINTVSICYRIGQTLIDTGPPNRWGAVRQFVWERPIQRVIVTHHHEDHAGNAAPLRHTLHLPVLAPAKSLKPLAEGFPVEFYRRLVWGRPEPVEAAPVPDETELANGWHLRAIPAPGHAPDMMCYLVPEPGWLFTADLFIARRPRYLRYDEDVPQLIRTLRDVLTLEFETIFCGHRGIVEHGKQALRGKLQYLETLCGQARDMHKAGHTISAITRQLLGRSGLLRWISGGDFSKQNLIASCVEDYKRVR